MRARKSGLLLLVVASVCIQLVCATLLKLASADQGQALPLVIGTLALVLALGFLRFLVWNRIHKLYPVSVAYPLSAVFFPAVVLLAWATGEPVGWMQACGAAVVMLGVGRMLSAADFEGDLP